MRALPRRALLIGAAWVATTPAHAQQEVSITVGPKSVALHVSNDSDRELRLNRLVRVERFYEEAWAAANTEMALNERCPDSGLADRKPGCVVLSPQQTITPPPWLGFACNGQCQRSCRHNNYLGPGTFRFVIRSCDGLTAVSSVPFNLPAYRDLIGQSG